MFSEEYVILFIISLMATRSQRIPVTARSVSILLEYFLVIFIFAYNSTGISFVNSSIRTHVIDFKYYFLFMWTYLKIDEDYQWLKATYLGLFAVMN